MPASTGASPISSATRTSSAPDALFDLLPPMWRFQLEGSGDVFVTQLRSIAEGPVEVEVVRTVPAEAAS